jgi:hypothetical protein
MAQMINGKWAMGHGLSDDMGHGKWAMGNGKCGSMPI